MHEEPSSSGAKRPSRRQFLALSATGLAASVAGCPDDGGNGSNGGDPKEIEPAEIPYDVDATRSLSEWERYDEEWSAPTTSPLSADLTTEILIENLEVPWDLSFADGTLFITERVGNVKAFEDGEVRTVTELDEAIDGGSVEPGSDEQSWWVDGGEGGTLGVAAHPHYPDPPLVYVYFTYDKGGNHRNRVKAFDVSADDPNEESWTIVDAIPGEQYHDGGRLEFGPRNRLWITTGDAGTKANAADPSSLGGKILRVNPDGSAPDDNPSFDENYDPRVFTYGHRNPQGVVWLPDGTPIANEHGPSPGRDEINHLVKGDFYGWQKEAIRDRQEYPNTPDVHDPIVNTGQGTTWAPTGSLFYTGEAVPALQNRMLIAGLISQQLVFATLTPEGGELPPADDGLRYDQKWTDDHYTATVHKTFENRLGRIRHLEQGPDGALYVITSNRDGRAKGKFPTERDDILARIVPAK